LNKLKHRNKLIRIADSSWAGWATILEYEKNDVASDSDSSDDKKICREEDRAISKLEKYKKLTENAFSDIGHVNSLFAVFASHKSQEGLTWRVSAVEDLSAVKSSTMRAVISPMIVQAIGADILAPDSWVQERRLPRESAILSLVKEQCVYEVPFIPHNVNPLSVATNSWSGTQRLILDLSVLNTFVKKDNFKFEDNKVAKEYLIPNVVTITFQLKAFIILIWGFDGNITDSSNTTFFGITFWSLFCPFSFFLMDCGPWLNTGEAMVKG
ncbi:hypothetical protein MAR_035756, partial [Mya arenaria]